MLRPRSMDCHANAGLARGEVLAHPVTAPGDLPAVSPFRKGAHVCAVPPLHGSGAAGCRPHGAAA